MKRPALIWWGSIGALAALDIWCHTNRTDGDTLSECARAAFRTHTPVGRAVFVCAWGVLTIWLIPHINRKVEKTLS